LHRYRAIVSNKNGLSLNGYKWTTKLNQSLYNVYPIYDWKTEDVWVYLGKNKHLPSNEIYSKMSMAGVKISQQRLCQPYGDDQRKGLWLYHILEHDTWYKLINRVSGVNSGALYIQENGNMTGYNHITKPKNTTWEQYCNVLLSTMPEITRNNYIKRFKKFIVGWKKRGYEVIPDEAPNELETKQWVPSWRRMVKSILRNDFYCKGLGQTQPLSESYQKYKEMKNLRKLKDTDVDVKKQIDSLEIDFETF
jgi:predicted phosphoadenosine phosphosulfate sulfurtransferase